LIIVVDESMGHDAILGRDFMEIFWLSINLVTLDTIEDSNLNNNTDNLNLFYGTMAQLLATSELANDSIQIAKEMLLRNNCKEMRLLRNNC